MKSEDVYWVTPRGMLHPHEMTREELIDAVVDLIEHVEVLKTSLRKKRE